MVSRPTTVPTGFGTPPVSTPISTSTVADAPAAPADDVRLPRAGQLEGWWAVAADGEVRDSPLAVRLAGQELALYRDKSGVVRAVDDLCPHRRLPLSLGRVTPDGHIQCGYHGWIFDGSSGRCTAIPNLTSEERPSGRIRLPVFTTASWRGFAVVWNGTDSAPALPDAAMRGPEPTFQGALDVRAPVALVLDALAVNPGAALGLGVLFGGGEEEAAVSVRRDDRALHIRRVRQTLGLRRIDTFDPFVDRVTNATTVVHLGTGLIEVIAENTIAGLTAQLTVGVAPVSGHRTTVRWSLGLHGRSASSVRRVVAAAAAMRKRTGRAAATFARLVDEVETQHDPATDIMRDLRSVSAQRSISDRDLFEELS